MMGGLDGLKYHFDGVAITGTPPIDASSYEAGSDPDDPYNPGNYLVFAGNSTRQRVLDGRTAISKQVDVATSDFG